MSNRMNVNPITTRNLLSLSWHDSQWIPILNASNIMDYFSEQSNPFFDRTCNNETIRMQRLNIDHLQNMTGIEYILLHVQEPILYVIRKQNRLSPSIAKPLVDYYIIAGIVYQAPDLSSVVNSRLLSTIHHLQSAFDEVSSFARYHPNKGYSWDFKNQNSATEKSTKAPESDGKANKDETASSQFQRHRVDMLLVELLKKFSVPQIPTTTSAAPITAVTSTTSATTTTTATIKSETESEKSEIKAEKSVKMSPPSDKNIKQASS